MPLTKANQGAIGAHVRRSTNQAITQNTTTAVQFTTETMDVGNLFDSGANTRFTPPTPGVYFVSYQASIDTAATIAIRLTGTTTYATQVITGNGATRSAAAINFNVGDYVELTVTTTVTGTDVTSAEFNIFGVS